MYPCPKCHQEMEVMDCDITDIYGDNLYGFQAILACVDCPGEYDEGEFCEEIEEEGDYYDDDDEGDFMFPTQDFY